MKQIELDYRGSLLHQYPDFMDAVRASVHGCGAPHKNIAADLDMSNSELSRRLAENPNDTLRFPLALLPQLLAATGDYTPLYWLCERFLQDAEARKKQAVSDLIRIMPQLHEILKNAE